MPVAPQRSKRISPTLNTIVELAMLHLLCKDFKRDTLKAHIILILDIDAAANRLRKRQLISITFMEPYCNVQETQDGYHLGRKKVQYCFSDKETDRYCKDV